MGRGRLAGIGRAKKNARRFRGRRLTQSSLFCLFFVIFMTLATGLGMLLRRATLRATR